MDPPREKVDICDICGDIGVDNAILTCSQCKINTEHMYCMRVPLEKPIDDWICEECEFTFKPGPQASSLPGEASRINSIEAAIKLSSGEKNSCAPVKFNWRSNPKGPKTGTNVFERTAVRSKTGPVNFSPQQDIASASAQQPKFNRPGNMEICKKQVQQSSKMTVPKHVSSLQPSQAPKNRDIQKELQKEIQWAQTKARKLVKRQSPIPSMNALPVAISGGNIQNTNEKRIGETEKTNTTALPDVEKLSRTPALNALWKGSFRICDDHRKEELNPQIHAHPPSRVLKKIYEFSKKMPQELHFQFVCAKTFLTNLFNEDVPEERNIALYFLPKGRSEDYIYILELISLRDLALRVQIDDVELLVFTSKLLPVNYRCLNGNYFLWGVFHRMKNDPAAFSDKGALNSSPPDVAPVDDRGEVNMDIDMVGGADVGRVDIAVEKESPGGIAASFKGGESTAPWASTGPHQQRSAFPEPVPKPATAAPLNVKMDLQLVPPGFVDVFMRRLRGS